MSDLPSRIRVRDDLLFMKFLLPGPYINATYCCIHMPSLVVSIQIPGEMVDLAFSRLPKEGKMVIDTLGTMGSINEQIYPSPSNTSAHPRYYFVLERNFESYIKMVSEVLTIEIDLSVPGPIKAFGRVVQEYTVPNQIRRFRAANDDVQLFFPFFYGDTPRVPPIVRSWGLGSRDAGRVANVEGIEEMRLDGVFVDRDAGYILAWVREGSLSWARDSAIIWWFSPTHTASPIKRLLSGWSQKLSKALKL